MEGFLLNAVRWLLLSFPGCGHLVVMGCGSGLYQCWWFSGPSLSSCWGAGMTGPWQGRLLVASGCQGLFCRDRHTVVIEMCGLGNRFSWEVSWARLCLPRAPSGCCCGSSLLSMMCHITKTPTQMYSSHTTQQDCSFVYLFGFFKF